MSVQDETWDRPICEFCNNKIGYGYVEVHSNARCLDDVSLYRQVKSHNKEVAENLRNYLIHLHNIIANVQAEHSDLNFKDILNGLKFQSK